MAWFYAHHFSVNMALGDGCAYLLSVAALPRATVCKLSIHKNDAVTRVSATGFEPGTVLLRIQRATTAPPSLRHNFSKFGQYVSWRTCAPRANKITSMSLGNISSPTKAKNAAISSNQKLRKLSTRGGYMITPIRILLDSVQSWDLFRPEGISNHLNRAKYWRVI